MKTFYTALLGATALATSAGAYAQQVAAPAPQMTVLQPQAAVASPVIAATEAQLPSNTELVLTLNSGLNTKTHRLGDKFSLTVAQDVKVDGHVVIPQGTRATGQITKATENGSFGKSGKMELTFRYVDLDGKLIPVEGTHWQEGQGNTAGTVGAIFAAGVIGGLVVKGHSASIPEGREFTVRTKESIPVTFTANADTPAVVSAAYTPSPVSMQVESEKERKAREKLEKATAKKKQR